MRHAAATALFLALSLPLAPRQARAQAQDNSATVEALFNEGKRLAAAGSFAQACPKFLASYNLEHRIGTVLNLADCYEKNGQPASAWARFVEARTLALRANQADRADYARQHADALLPRLSKLTIAVPQAAPGLQVARDGTAVDAGAFGVAVPVDPGDHVIEASAPGKQTWKGTVKVAGDSASASIEIPALVDAPLVPTPGVAGPTGAEEKHGLSGRSVAGIAIAGVGVVAIGVGSVFGVIALGKKSDSSQYCGSDGNANDCYAPGATLRHDGAVDGNVSTVLIAAGAGMTIGGVALWLWPSSSSSEPSAAVSFDLHGVRVGGRF